MVFSSLTFLYFFLPLTLLLYFSAAEKYRNLILLSFSLLFYTWGEFEYVILMLFSIVMNWIMGIVITRPSLSRNRQKLWLAIGISLNLLPLLYFKYGNFLLNNITTVFPSAIIDAGELKQIHLPIGISFFTFQAISYIVDIYRNTSQVQRNPINLALYISLFPQLIAGPIVRYHDISKQITNRAVNLTDFQYGILRFTVGLGKKVIIANNLGAFVDHIYTLPVETVPAHLLWLGMLCYTLQIYYDFSGYSDMAIGLGRMFGFRFLENFNYPYSSKSIQEFWRRWHISLSSWFRDYLYIPLGGNKNGERRTYINLLIVFFLCGLWHGASWTFVAWGLYHGFFLILERRYIGKIINNSPAVLSHCYTLLVVMAGWVFFRAETFEQAWGYLYSLLNFSTKPYLDAKLFATMNTEFYFALIIGIIFSYPISPRITRSYKSLMNKQETYSWHLLSSFTTILFTSYICFTFYYCTLQLVSGSHNPFLYFRF